MKLSRRGILIGASAICANIAYGQQLKDTPVLITNFSRTGNTKKIASLIQKITGGDVFDIKPTIAYPTNYDLTVQQAREEIEQDYRPLLYENIKNIDNYKIVFVGYPIWSMTLPPVMRSFLASHNLSNKTIVPFCTHKAYGIGNSVKIIKQMVPKAQFLEEFSIEGEKVDNASADIELWLRKVGIIYG